MKYMVNIWEKNTYAYINFSILCILFTKIFQGKNFVIPNKIYILQNFTS